MILKTLNAKVVILGAEGVGKSNLILRYVNKIFEPRMGPTVGAAFFSCNIPVGDINVRLQIWDTAGQERFKSMAPMFYRNAKAAIVVYDITSYESFTRMKAWVKEIHRNIDESIVLCVVGNKIDLNSQREVEKNEGMQYANSVKALFHETSVKLDQSVGLVFESVAYDLVRSSGANIPIVDEAIEVMDNIVHLEATDTAREELVHPGIDNIAHGRSVTSSCC